MGNQQSMPASDGDLPIAQKRFSRIKSSTNSSSTSPSRSYQNDGIHSSVTKLAIGGYWDSDSALVSPSKEVPPRLDQPWQKVKSPLQSPSEEPEYFDGQAAAAYDDRLGRTLTEITPFHSAMSSTAQLPSETQALSAQDTANVDLQTAIRLLEELRKTASPEDLVALHRALLPARSADPLSPTDPSFGASVAGVMRMKSMAKPGLATRKIIKRRVTNKKDKNTQSIANDPENLPWKAEMITASPLERLTSLDIDREVAVKWAPRAETPATMDYASLGNYGLGTLVVTNGMASPAPSIMSRSRTPMLPSLDTDTSPTMPFVGRSPGSPPFVDAMSAQLSDIEPPPPPPPAHGPTPATSFLQNDASQSDHIPPTKPWLRTHKRSQSPLRNEWSSATEQARFSCPGNNNEDGDDDEDHILVRPSLAHQKRMSALSVLDSVERKEMEDTRTKIDITEDRMAMAHESAVSLASIYQADLPASPFASTVQKSRESYAPTDYHSVSSIGIEEDEETGHGDTASDVEKSRKAALSALEEIAPASSGVYRDVTPDTALSSHPIPRPRSPVSPISPMEEDQPEFPIIVLKNADSGYSSGVSANGSALIPQGPSEVSLVRPTTETTTLPVDRQSVEEVGTARMVMLRSHTMPEGPISLPTAQPDIASTSEEPKAIIEMEIDSKERALRKAATTPESRPAVKERSKSWRKSMRQSLPKFFSSEDLLNKQEKMIIQEFAPSKKLQKKRPTTPGAPTHADPHISIAYVPAVPVDVFSRFSDRMADRKTKDALDRTYVHDAKVDTQRHIPFASVPISFPDNDFDLDAERGRTNARHGSEEPPQPPRHRFGLSSRRSSHQKDLRSEVKPAVADQLSTPAPRGLPEASHVPQSVPRYDRPAQQDPLARGNLRTTPAPHASARTWVQGQESMPHASQPRPMTARPQSYYEGSFQAPLTAIAGAQDPRQLRRPRSMHGNTLTAAPAPRPRTSHQENTMYNRSRSRSRHGEPAPHVAPPSSMPDSRPPRPRSAHPREGERLPLHDAPPAQRVSAMPRRPFSMVSHPPNERPDTGPMYGGNRVRQPAPPSRSSSVYDELPSQRRRLSTRERMPSGTNVPSMINSAPPEERRNDNWPILQDPQKLDVEVGEGFVVDWAAESQKWKERKMQAESNITGPGPVHESHAAYFVEADADTSTAGPVQPVLQQKINTAPTSSRSSVYESNFSRPSSVINRMSSGDNSGTSTPDARITRTKSSPNHTSTSNRPVSILKTSSSRTNFDLQDVPILDTQQMNLTSLRNALRPSASSTDIRSAPSSAYSTASSYLPNEGRNIPAVAKYAEEGIFGRYGGGFRHSKTDFSRREDQKPARPRSILSRSRNNSSTSVNRIPSDGKRGQNLWANDGADHGVDLVDVPVLSGSLSLVGTYDFR